ncbi:MAG: hypothetical protein WC679_05230 [Bacteroidales bacterium]|jgi:antitoxin component YwqK of YwqJK toxin-antitoxin module
MRHNNLTSLLSKVIILSLIIVLSFSCSKGSKEIISSYENGNPKLVYYTKTEKGIKKKVSEQMFYENGKIRYEGNFQHNERTGKWSYNFEDGTKFATCNYTKSKSGFDWEIYKADKTKLVNSKDKISGITFYTDGCLARIMIKNEKQEKEYRFFPSFNLMEDRTMKGNVLNGQTLSFYENGHINSSNYFKNGIQDGTYILYYENGSQQIKGNYRQDNRVGKWEYFKQDGSPDGEEIYGEDGSIIKQRATGLKYFDKDGNEIKL